MVTVERLVDDERQPGTHIGAITVANGLNDEVTQWTMIEEDISQHVKDLAA